MKEDNNIEIQQNEEQINKKKDKDLKKNNILIVLLIILLLIIISLIIYILYDNRELFSNNNKDKQVSNSNIEENTIKDTVSDEKQENTLDTNYDSSSNNQSPLDINKVLNTNGITYKNASEIIGDYGISMNINSDKKSITLSINWPKFGPSSGASAWSESVVDYQITGFTKEIKDTFIGELGQDARGLTLFYLMSDGTVEYTPLFNLKYDSYNNSYYEMNYTYNYSSDGRASGEHFLTKGSLSGVSNVIKLYNVDAYNSNGSGYRTTIGAKADGSFFDLGHVINNK